MLKIVTFFVCVVIRQISCNNGEGECYREIAIGEQKYENRTFCCDHYERINGTCIECAVGYSSKADFPCEQCSDKRYGLKCVELCACTKEKCDHMRGCTSEVSSNETGMSVRVTPENSVLLRTSSTKTETGTEKHTQGVLIYIICAGSVTLVITVTGIVMMRKRKRKQIDTPVRFQLNNVSNPQTQDLPDEIYTIVL